MNREGGVGDHRPLFDQGRSATCGTTDVAYCLLDHRLDLRTIAGELKDLHVLRANHGPKDLALVHDGVGASVWLGHPSSLKHLRRVVGDPWHANSPPESEEPHLATQIPPLHRAR